MVLAGRSPDAGASGSTGKRSSIPSVYGHLGGGWLAGSLADDDCPLLDREISRFCAFQDLVHERVHKIGRAVIHVGNIQPVAYQTSDAARPAGAHALAAEAQTRGPTSPGGSGGTDLARGRIRVISILLL